MGGAMNSANAFIINDDTTAALAPEAVAGRRVPHQEPPDLSGLVGRRLGGFRIIKSLGSGAVGTVYLAEQVALGRLVALKVLSGTRSASPEHLARFVREARAVAKLVHPNAVQVYDIGEAAGYHYIALEYVDGETVTDLLRRRGRLPWPAALEIARQAALSLGRGHEMGIIHRDIKPENLMLSRRGEVKLADFGLASLNDEPAITRHGTILGTPLYMSPEQAAGKPAGPAADIYSLGATLYHMLTGQPPFDGKSGMAVVQKHVNARPRPPVGLVPDLPGPVSDLVLRMLAKQPEGRPGSAGELIRDILAVRAVAGNGSEAAGPRPTAAGDGREGKVAGGEDPAATVKLSREELRELLACEATCACLVPQGNRRMLEATMRTYGIPIQHMRPLLEKRPLTRDDVWFLQAQKRTAQGNRRALGIIHKLRRMEAQFKTDLLRAYLAARSAELRRQPPNPAPGQSAS